MQGVNESGQVNETCENLYTCENYTTRFWALSTGVGKKKETVKVSFFLAATERMRRWY